MTFHSGIQRVYKSYAKKDPSGIVDNFVFHIRGNNNPSTEDCKKYFYTNISRDPIHKVEVHKESYKLNGKSSTYSVCIVYASRY